MSKPYVMKDLGYPRRPTSAMFRVEMPDGSKWDVPVQAIVDCRDEFYKDDEEDTIRGIRDGDLDDGEIQDWAGNEMNWDEVAEYAVEVPGEKEPVDFQDGWCNGEKEIVGSL